MRPENRQGMVLLSVLWGTMVIATLVATSLAIAHHALMLTRNRVVATGERWAAAGCEARFLSRLATDSLVTAESLSFENGSWCQAVAVSLNARLNVRTADNQMLARMFPPESVVAAIVLLRGAGAAESTSGLQNEGQLRQVPGLASLTDTDLALLTVDGDGRINPNVAPEPVLLALPGISPELAHRIATVSRKRPLVDLSSLADLATPADRDALARRWSDLAARVTFEQGPLEVRIRSGSRLAPVEFTERLVVIPHAPRPMVVQREAW